jgi:hypothetical protein
VAGLDERRIRGSELGLNIVPSVVTAPDLNNLAQAIVPCRAVTRTLAPGLHRLSGEPRSARFNFVRSKAMALDFNERLRLQQVVVPVLVPYLRMLRSIGVTDVRAQAKSNFQDLTPLNNGATVRSVVLAQIGSPLSSATASAITAEEMSAFIDAAMLQI